MNPDTDRDLEEVIRVVYEIYKYDFRLYSRASLRRRSTAALLKLGLPDLKSLATSLEDPLIFDEYLQYLTIPVTEMFRDPDYFRAVRETVLPHLHTYPSLKIWIAGCSTGEEAYSMAILLDEDGLLGRSLIYATDINPRSLSAAKAGIYSSSLVSKYTKNYHDAGGRGPFSNYYQESYGAIAFPSDLKSRILFTDHSLSTDNVFAEVNFVSCRNVLIYFERELQLRAVQLFHDSLTTRGFLGVGEKESLKFFDNPGRFVEIDSENKIYQKQVAR